MKHENEFMINAQGHHVPVDKVKPADKLQDHLVMDLHTAACEISSQLSSFKRRAFQDADALLQLLAEQYNAQIGGAKGNVTLTSFDGKYKVEISVGSFLQFGPELKVAKALIDECIRDWAGGAHSNIKALIYDAFEVDKNNRLNVDRILGLRRLDITDEKWQRAMQAITDSVKVSRTKRYVRFYRRPSPESEWQAVLLDIAKVSIPLDDADRG